MKRWVGMVAALALAAGVSGCGGDDTSSEGGGDDDTTLVIYAASSLKTTFEAIGEDFEGTHDGVTVEFNFAGSSDLVAQIQQGAPADIFASADTANMEKLTAEDLIGSGPEDFASNTLEIAVPPDNPASIESLEDLTKDGVNLVICAVDVPCGAATQSVADAAGLTFEPVSEEQSVTDVLNKVTTGEADAGLVYVTDVRAAGDTVEGIEFPESADVVNIYPIGTVADSANGDLAQEFMDLVLDDTGQTILEDAGFGKP